MKKWSRKCSWRISGGWYRTIVWFGWWYCEHCEKMHSPFTSKYEFEDQEYECHRGVYDIPVPKSFESDPEYFYNLAKELHRVG